MDGRCQYLQLHSMKKVSYKDVALYTSFYIKNGACFIRYTKISESKGESLDTKHCERKIFLPSSKVWIAEAKKAA